MTSSRCQSKTQGKLKGQKQIMELHSKDKQRKIKIAMNTVSETIKTPTIKALTLPQAETVTVPPLKGLGMPLKRMNVETLLITHFFTCIPCLVSCSKWHFYINLTRPLSVEGKWHCGTRMMALQPSGEVTLDSSTYSLCLSICRG